MSHDDQDRPNLKRLAQQAPGFLAEPLFAYQVTHQLTNKLLAAEIGVPIEQLENLALCTAPGDIERESLRRTFTSLAEEIGIDEKSIKLIFADSVHAHKQKIQFSMPRYLGIDKVKIDGAMRGAFTDIEKLREKILYGSFQSALDLLELGGDVLFQLLIAIRECW